MSANAIGLGDLARALDRLAPEDAATREQIAKLVGLELREIPQEKDGPSSPAPPETETPSTRVPPPPRDAEPDSAPLLRIDPVSREPSRPLRLLLNGPSLDPPPGDFAPLPFAPLFKPAWERNLISATVATRAPNGPVDLPRLVDTAARGRPLRTIPRLPQPSLFRGVQVLVDLGEGMEPFARDQVHLLEEIRRIVGDEASAVVQFRNNPLRGAGATPWTWGPYRPPHPGTPVLALTDLGIGGPLLDPDRSNEREWLTFAERLAHAACPFVALVPYPEQRWPRKLRRQITIISWDRSTTVGEVFRKIRRGHEVRL